MSEILQDTIEMLEKKVEATLDLIDNASDDTVKREWSKNYKPLMENLKKLGSMKGGKERLKQWPAVAIIDVLTVAKNYANYKLPAEFDLKDFIRQQRVENKGQGRETKLAGPSGNTRAEKGLGWGGGGGGTSIGGIGIDIGEPLGVGGWVGVLGIGGKDGGMLDRGLGLIWLGGGWANVVG
ncbi:hypothetical protein BJ165DRAFT_1407836 [Panaeolus papilionaceus]|nr:hypothetical protein BJ165DRAFT_1407836 [Panaeolus papilionaceus]